MEAENHKLKEMYADLSLEHKVLKDIVEKVVTVAEHRNLVHYAIATHQMSERQACAMLDMSRSVYRYKAKPSDDEDLREQLLTLAARKPRWGLQNMFAYLWSHALAKNFRSQGLTWLAHCESTKREKEPWPKWLEHKRYRIETMIGQLVERFYGKKVWARDAWHLISRWYCKILSHTMAVFLCQEVGFPI